MTIDYRYSCLCFQTLQSFTTCRVFILTKLLLFLKRFLKLPWFLISWFSFIWLSRKNYFFTISLFCLFPLVMHAWAAYSSLSPCPIRHLASILLLAGSPWSQVIFLQDYWAALQQSFLLPWLYLGAHAQNVGCPCAIPSWCGNYSFTT